MKKANFFFSVLILVFFLAVWGCGDDGDLDVTGCGGDVLCVGVLTPDPSVVNFAQGIAEAARAAETGIRSADGSIELHVKEVGDCDDYSEPRMAAEELIGMGVNAIVGHICSGVSNSILGGGKEDAVSGIENIIMISPANTSTVFSSSDAIYKYYFRTAPSDLLQGSLLAERIKETPPPTYMIYRNDPWGESLKEELLENGVSAEGMTMQYDKEDPDTDAIEEFLADKGRINVAVIAFDEAENIMKKLLGSDKISDDNRYYFPDGYYTELEKLKEDLQRLGQDDLEENPETLAELFHTNSSGFLSTTPDSYEYDDNELKEEQKTFRSNHDDDYTANTYDAVTLLALAYLSAGSAEPAALAEELLRVSDPPGRCIRYQECAMQIADAEADINYEGLSGPIDFDEKGDIQGASYKILSYFNRTVYEEGNVSAP